jgi:branched-chain amino acid transport system ATP-binding protein
MTLLRCVDVSISFGGLQALDEVELGIGEWEVVGLIGPNGAGKTTLFNCITGLYRPDHGRVWFRGEDVTDLPTHRRAALGMGRTFQQVGLVRSLSVGDNLILAQHSRVGYGVASALAALPGVRAEERRLRRNADEILDFLGLSHLREEPVTGLPYGTLRLVELGQALATDPALLLLDEPSSGMGPEEAEDLGEVILRLRDELELTVFVIEHHVPFVVQVCDYIYVLNFGRLLARGEPQEIQGHPEVIAAYLGEEGAA